MNILRWLRRFLWTQKSADIDIEKFEREVAEELSRHQKKAAPSTLAQKPSRPTEAQPAVVTRPTRGEVSEEMLKLLPDVRSRLPRRSVPERDRVARCILHLAHGDTSRIEDLIDSAIRDFRDVIFWAEYDKSGRRIYDFSQPLKTETSVPFD